METIGNQTVVAQAKLAPQDFSAQGLGLFTRDEVSCIVKMMMRRKVHRWKGGAILSAAQQCSVRAEVASLLGCSERVQLLALLMGVCDESDQRRGRVDEVLGGSPQSWEQLFVEKMGFSLLLEDNQESPDFVAVTELADGVCREAVRCDGGGDFELQDVLKGSLTDGGRLLVDKSGREIRGVVGCRPMAEWYAAMDFEVTWRYLYGKHRGAAHGAAHGQLPSGAAHGDKAAPLRLGCGLGTHSAMSEGGKLDGLRKVVAEKDAAIESLSKALQGATRFNRFDPTPGCAPDPELFVVLEVVNSVPGAQYQTAKWSPTDRSFWSFSGRYVQPREVIGWRYVVPPTVAPVVPLDGANGDKGGGVVKAN